MEVVKMIKLGAYKNLGIEGFVGDTEEKVVELINRVMRRVLDNVEIQYNREAIDENVDRMFRDLEKEVEEKEIGMELLCHHYGISGPEKLKEALEGEVATTWLEIATLNEIAAKENLILTDSEYEEARTVYLERSGQKEIEPEAEPDFRKSVLFTKVVDFLVRENVQS